MLTVVGLEVSDRARLLVAGEMPDNVTGRISGIDTTVEIVSLIDSGVEMRTLFLIDSSVNLMFANQILNLLDFLIENKHPDELFSIAIINEGYNQLVVDFTDDRFDLYRARNTLTWENYESRIDQAVGIAVQQMITDQNNAFQFNQIVVLSDGRNVIEGGITREELILMLGNSYVTVHTVGFMYNPYDPISALFDIHAFSRVSGGIGYDMVVGVVDEFLTYRTSVLAERLGGFIRNIYYVRAEFPEQLMDGAIRPLELLNEAGVSLLNYGVYVPVAEILPEATPLATPTPTPPPVVTPLPLPEPVAESAIPPFVIPLALILVVGGASVLIAIAIKNKKGQSSKVNSGDSVPVAAPPQVEINDKVTEFVNNDSTVFLGGSDDSVTMFINENNNKGSDGKYYLILTDTLQPHKRFEVVVENSVVIGREPGQLGIMIDYDSKISRRHCSVSLRGGQLWIEDLVSSNGTFVNDDKLDTPRMIVNNDIVTVADTKFSVLIEQRQ